MARFERFDEILQLGQKIVDELGRDQTVDTLGRWMAHYIAELMDKVKGATGDELNAKQYECAKAILALWEQRSTMPNGKRPFEEFEPIFRALGSLDPDDRSPRYFRHVPWAEADSEEQPETKQWLDMAHGIDDTARSLIRYCLVRAVTCTTTDSEEWARLSEAINADDDDAHIVGIVIRHSNELLKEDPKGAEKARLEKLRDCLVAFADVASTLSSDISERLRRSG